jgi:hypothetical protein
VIGTKELEEETEAQRASDRAECPCSLPQSHGQACGCSPRDQVEQKAKVTGLLNPMSGSERSEYCDEKRYATLSN